MKEIKKGGRFVKKIWFLLFMIAVLIVFSSCANGTVKDGLPSNNGGGEINADTDKDPCEALGHDYADATCTAAKTCKRCSATEGKALGHDYADATCTAAKTCKRCGVTEGEALGHDYADATCTAAKTCKRCSATEGKALGHDYADATCTAAKTCKRCSATEGKALGHDYADATCTAAKTCKRCGATEGKALGHDYADATCTAAKTCKRCGVTEGEALGHDYADATCTAAKTCKRCGVTEGKALGHNWSEPTCLSPKSCKRCGKKDGEALGHDWKEATTSAPKTCKRCGAKVGETLPPEYTDRLEGREKIRRSMLNELERSLYDKYLPYVLSYTPFKVYPHEMNYDAETLYNALEAIEHDYPETRLYFATEVEYDLENWDFESDISNYILYYSSAYFYLEWSEEGRESFNKEDISEYIARIDGVCDEIIAKMPKNLSTREKYVWLADYVCSITEYLDDPNGKYRHADGPLLYGKGICQSYAYAYQWLCQKAGLWNITCSGMAGGIGHCWNVVMLDDGQTYYMDLTWADDSSNPSQYYFMTYEQCIKHRDIDEGEWIATGK